MAVFGVPVLHEDDALRAVRAAAGLREQIAVLNTELETDFGASVSVRTGVNTGQVVTGTDERLATGDAVNLAARLEQAAAPGEIVIGPQTWALVRDAVEAEPLGPLRLKGKSAPVTAYRLLQVHGDVHPRPGWAGRRWWAGAASCGCSPTRSRTWYGSVRAACSRCWAWRGWASRGWRRSSCAAPVPGW